MIRDALIPALEREFPANGLRIGAPPDPVAVFPARHPEIGDVCVWDDGEEATVAIGEITHGHFNVYDDSLTDAQIAERVTSDVVVFLKQLFSDRVALWQAPGGRAGGWRIGGVSQAVADVDAGLMDPIEVLQAGAKWFVWSGPVASAHLAG